ncbi:hypothetical protein [Streptomyces halobius]|uniref:DUF5808 domain-containing protein n=1 Tax=Streptomyces halobius TaxID=2879846 RepID=A0ABY4MDB4_9ACTN|nr:hypothetical protein [Streptomyces halobius]UQA95708.1 hypothetical protein K9S39_31030 [Streptomyces halobius]
MEFNYLYETGDAPGRPARHTSVSISAFGVRMQADGRTRWQAWKVIRREHPVLAWAAPLYVGLLLGLAVAVALAVT